MPPVKYLVAQAVRFIGDGARPYALIAIGTATAKVIWSEANEGVIIAAGAILTALYSAKALENYGEKRETRKTVEATAAAKAGTGQ